MSKPQTPPYDPIFDDLFKVQFPQLAATSPAYIERFGMPISGDPGVDAALANQRITTFKTINDMVELFREGVPVWVVSKEDVKTIYGIIDTRLRVWQEKIRVGVNLGNPPYDDLILMDRFAQLIHNNIAYDLKPEEIDSPFLRFLNEGKFFSGGGFFKEEVKTSATEDFIPEQRDSLSDIFKRGKVLNSKPWRA